MNFLASFAQRRLAALALAVLVLLVLAAVLAPWLSTQNPYDLANLSLSDARRPPGYVGEGGYTHWLGTDELGRDLLARIAAGGRHSLGMAAAIALAATLAGTLLGLLAGFVKPLEVPLMRLVDAMMALPDLLLAIALVAILGPSAWNVVLALSLVYTPRVARVVRASTLVVRELPFVEAARALGARLEPERTYFGLAARVNRPAGPVWLLEPQTFMNLSGDAVSRVAAFHKLDAADVLVVVDEVQLPVGRLRFRRSGSAGGHNGLKSIIQHIGPEFPRLRLGVGRGDPKWDLADHVLSRFAKDEREAVSEAIGKAADAVELFVTDGVETAMNRFNAAE